jgi:hypothetical protein
VATGAAEAAVSATGAVETAEGVDAVVAASEPQLDRIPASTTAPVPPSRRIRDEPIAISFS